MEDRIFSKHPNRRLAKFYRGLPSPVSSWKKCGVSLVYTGAEHFVGGLTFEPTVAGPSLRWMTWWVVPLFTLKQYLSLGFGERIPTDDRFAVRGQLVAVDDGAEYSVERTYDAILDEGVPKIHRMSEMAQFYSFLRSGKSRNLDDCWDHYAMAGCSVYLGAEAVVTLAHIERARSVLSGMSDQGESLDYLATLESRVRTGSRDSQLSFLSEVESVMRERYGVF